MKSREIQALLDEPACHHNHKEKSGCARLKPGATAGGCAFDGAQIALLPLACAGNSWDNRGDEIFRRGVDGGVGGRKWPIS